MKDFKKPAGHEKCTMSQSITGHFTFGRGRPNLDGFFDDGCPECARAYEAKFPEDNLCWPFAEGKSSGVVIKK